MPAGNGAKTSNGVGVGVGGGGGVLGWGWGVGGAKDNARPLQSLAGAGSAAGLEPHLAAGRCPGAPTR